MGWAVGGGLYQLTALNNKNVWCAPKGTLKCTPNLEFPKKDKNFLNCYSMFYQEPAAPLKINFQTLDL